MPHNWAVEPEHDAQDDAQILKTIPPAARPSWWKRRTYGQRVAVGVVSYVLVAIPVVLYAPGALLNNWVPGQTPEEQGKLLGAAGNLVLLALGGVIAVVTVGLSLSRHRQEIDAAERDRQRLLDDQKREQARLSEVDRQRRIETERVLRERFVTTVKLLSDPAPVNRQAALFALGALADDWDAFGNTDEVQVCIEVLTSYLRAPRSDDMLSPLDAEEAHYLEPEDYYDAQRTTPQEVSVKQAGYTVIRNHIQWEAAPNWHDRPINLARAHIDFHVELLRARVDLGGVIDLTAARIAPGGTVDLGAVRISNRGRVSLMDARISGAGGVDMTAADVSNHGMLTLMNVTLTRALVLLVNAKITNYGSVIIRNSSIRHGASVDLKGAEISDGGTVDLMASKISADRGVILRNAKIRDGGSVNLGEAVISDGGIVDLSAAKITHDGIVDLGAATIDDRGHVNLSGALISDGGSISLTATTIGEGGYVIRPNGVRSKKAKSEPA